MEELFYLSLLIFAGMIMGKTAKKVKLPNVTGYLIAGLILGPSVLKLIPADAVDKLSFISEIALGFIAFSIGGEFKISYFKRVGFTPIVIAIFEALAAVFLVALVLAVAGYELQLAIVLGAIAAATAPAATIMVVNQYRAKGPVTETLLSVVALDDAVALISFGVAVAIANMIGNPEAGSLFLSILDPIVEIFGSLLLGAVLGLVFSYPLKFWKDDGNRLCLLYAFIFLAIAASTHFGFSNLLTCMAMGSILANVSIRSDAILRIQDFVTPPIFLVFFALSGAGLNLSILSDIGLIGIIYVVMRVIGKFVGAWLGAKIMHAEQKIQRYLGWTLVPQAGVAIGLTLVAQTVVPDYAQTIRAVVLCGTMIYEIIGPSLSKWALKKAGEIDPNA